MTESTKMPSVLGHSAACCNIPPVISKGYSEKGKYETINGLKTCDLAPFQLAQILNLITEF